MPTMHVVHILVASDMEQPMTPGQLKSWRKRLSLSQTEAADALGLSLRGFQNLEGGQRRIRKFIALACAAVAMGLVAFSPQVEAKGAKMKIVIEAIDHAKQRYPTAGDYWREKDGTLHVVVSKMADQRYELLVAIHELVEMSLVDQRGISHKAIDEFDMGIGKDLAEPGDDPRAPYHAEHMVASEIERRMAAELGVDWDKYAKAIEALDP